MAWDLDVGLDALRRLLELDLEVIAKIRSALRSGAPAAAAEPEDVAESPEDVFEAGELGGVEALGGAADAGVAESIVARTLVAVAQDRIGLGRFLELVFGRFVALIAIGMKLERQLAIRALDLLLRGGPGDLEDHVIIALAHDAFATFTRAGRNSRSPSL
jgi:hypothetical protein